MSISRFSSSSDEDTDTRLLYSYPMGQGFWDSEMYEEEDVNDYNVTINRDGIPILINQLLPFTEVYPVKKSIFVFTMDDVLRMGHRLHHSDLMHGYPVKCAGEVFFSSKTGSIIGLSNRSGHYTPSVSCLEDVVEVIRQNGYNGKIKLMDEKKTQTLQKPLFRTGLSFKKNK